MLVNGINCVPPSAVTLICILTLSSRRYPHAVPYVFCSQRPNHSKSVFNVFRSVIAYDTSIKTIPNLAKAEEEIMVEYEFEPDTKDEVLEVSE